MIRRSDHPAPMEPDVVARILRRASELAESGDASGAGDTDGRHGRAGVGEPALLAAADEVGLPVAAVRRSLAVERLGPPVETRRIDRVVGASVVAVDDELAGSVADVLERLDGWMVDGHHLRRERRRDEGGTGRAEWTKRSGLVGVTVRKIRSATGEGRLGELRRVTAVAADTGVGTCAVRVSADRNTERQVAIGAGAALAVTGTAGVVAAAVVASPFVLLASPATVAIGIGVAAVGRSRAERTRREIERLLDTVDQGDEPVRLRVDVARRLTGRSRRGQAALDRSRRRR